MYFVAQGVKHPSAGAYLPERTPSLDLSSGPRTSTVNFPLNSNYRIAVIAVYIFSVLDGDF